MKVEVKPSREQKETNWSGRGRAVRGRNDEPRESWRNEKPNMRPNAGYAVTVWTTTG